MAAVLRRDDDRFPTRAAAAIVLVALALRLGLGLTRGDDLSSLPDQVEYLQLAESVAAGDGFVLVDERYATPQTLYAQRMPGYPLFVLIGGTSVKGVRVLQAVVDASTVLATFLIARRLASRRAALAAAAIVAVNPFLAYFSTLLLTETLFTALVAWGTLGLLLSRDRGLHWWWAAILFAVATYVRPTGGVLFVAMALVASRLPTRGPGGPTRWPLPAGLTALLVIGLALVPWTLRNAHALGAFVPTTTNAGITLHDGLNPDNATGGSDQGFVRRMPQLALMDEVERSAYLREKAIAFARERPVRALTLAGQKVLRTWSPWPLSEGVSAAGRVAAALFAVPVFVLAGIGVLAWRMPRGGKAVLLTPIVVLTAVHAASVGSLRYRLPAEPMLAVFAACGAAVVARRAGDPRPTDVVPDAGA